MCHSSPATPVLVSVKEDLEEIREEIRCGLRVRDSVRRVEFRVQVSSSRDRAPPTEGPLIPTRDTDTRHGCIDSHCEGKRYSPGELLCLAGEKEHEGKPKQRRPGGDPCLSHSSEDQRERRGGKSVRVCEDRKQRSERKSECEKGEKRITNISQRNAKLVRYVVG